MTPSEIPPEELRTAADRLDQEISPAVWGLLALGLMILFAAAAYLVGR